MDLSKCLNQLKLDHRMVDWNIRNGLVTQEEWKKHLSALPDLADRCEKLKLELEYDSANGRDYGVPPQ